MLRATLLPVLIFGICIIICSIHQTKNSIYQEVETGLENVDFPASLRTISQEAFSECENLKTAKFAEGLEVLGTDERQRVDR